MKINWINGGNWYHTKIGKIDISIHSNVEYVKELNANKRIWTIYLGVNLWTPKKFYNSLSAKKFVEMELINILENEIIGE